MDFKQRKTPLNRKDSPKISHNHKVSNQNTNIKLKVLSRTTIITSLLIIIYFSKRDDKLQIFSKQSETLTGKEQTIDCSLEYITEVKKFEGCFPKVCKRYVSDVVISSREIEDLLKMAKKVLKLGGSLGGASILDLHSGALSKGKDFVNIYKMNLGHLLTEHDFNTYRAVKEKIKYTLAHNFEINPDKLFSTYPTFFSQITSKDAVTLNDEYWHPHIDKETYESFHYTALLYLNDYNIDFKGGKFIFVDKNVNKTIEPRKARLSMFTSGAENLHFVEKVTDGVRYALTIPFTCDLRYAIDDPNVNKFDY